MLTHSHSPRSFCFAAHTCYGRESATAVKTSGRVRSSKVACDGKLSQEPASMLYDNRHKTFLGYLHRFRTRAIRSTILASTPAGQMQDASTISEWTPAVRNVKIGTTLPATSFLRKSVVTGVNSSVRLLVFVRGSADNRGISFFRTFVTASGGHDWDGEPRSDAGFLAVAGRGSIRWCSEV